MSLRKVRIMYCLVFQMVFVLGFVQPMLTVTTECTEGSMSADPTDCSSYYQCLNGEIIKQNCANKSYFDITCDVCVIDIYGICHVELKNCTDQKPKEDPLNPCGYLQCINGSIEKLNCPTDSYFNVSYETCIFDVNGICSIEKCTEGQTEVNSKDLCGYLQCTNGNFVEVSCANGTYFNSTYNACIIDEKGICPSKRCIEGKIEVNPKDLCGYLQCSNGSLVEVSCANGTYFNSTYNACFIDENGICPSEKCSEGEIEANPKDLCGYLQCSNGTLVEVSCANGTYFNSTYNACFIDENGICPSERCTEGEIEVNPKDLCGYLQCSNGSLVEVSCANGTYFNSTYNACFIDENGICPSEKCTEGEIEVNPKDLCGYLQCSNGTLVEVSCANGTYFNSTYNACFIDENGICPSERCTEGEIEVNPKDLCGYLQCSNGSLVEVSCANGTYFNSTYNACFIDENGICPSEKCTEGEIEVNPKDLCGYLQCSNGTLVEVSCANGTYFNSTYNACFIDENGICPSERCTEGEIEVNPKDLCGYLQCSNGSLVEVSCANGTYFNSTYNACFIDENGICPSEKCTEGEIEVNPKDLCGYLQCSNGTLVEVSCANGTYFNSTYNACFIDENGICPSEKCTEGEIEVNPKDLCGYLQCSNGSLVEVSCANGTYFNSTYNACFIDENGICPSERCAEGEIEVNPKDLCGYLQCSNGSLVEVSCANGTYFNSTYNACFIDERGICPSEKCTEGEIEVNPKDLCGYLQCSNGSLVEVSCANGTYFNSTYNACFIDMNGICPSERCTEGEVEVNPSDFCGYLQCSNGSLVQVSCANGTYFNSTYNACLIDENGLCLSKGCTENETEVNPQDRCGYLQCINGRLVEINCISGSYYNATYHACIIDTTGACSAASSRGRSCLHGEIDKNPEDCASYFQCMNGTRVRQLCSYGSYFHSILKSCVVDVNGICLANSEQCVEGKREIDPEDCASYYECIDEDFVAQTCAKGSYFNSKIKSCAIDEHFICISQTSK